MSGQIPERLREATAEHPAVAAWLERAAEQDPVGIDISLPDGKDLLEALRWLDVPPAAAAEIAKHRPDPATHSEGWWMLERAVAMLVSGMGEVAELPAFPALPEHLPGVPPHLFIHVFVATLPHVLAYHRSRSIDEAASQAILADLGRNVRVHDKRYGDVGLGVVPWITLHFRGLIYDLGRLQFERGRLGATLVEAIRETGEDADPDELVLSLHIPDYKGPLSPAAIDDALREAACFFSQHFPDERYRFAVCHSWLLDPQLARYLRDDANIVRFQRRFSLAERENDGDRSIVQFVFGPVPDDPADLPARTSLERAVRTHLVAGGHWHFRSGWFTLGGSAWGEGSGQVQ